jgi:hypothetical protein
MPFEVTPQVYEVARKHGKSFLINAIDGTARIVS